MIGRWPDEILQYTGPRRADQDFIVIRPAADLPAGVLRPEWDGVWFDKGKIGPTSEEELASPDRYVAVPTGRFEVRSDGAVAEVYEVRP